MAVPNTSVTPSTWNGSYPLSDLPAGETWTGTYDGATQCVGFAKMVLGATYGLGTTESGDDFTFGSSDSNTVKQIFEDKNVEVGDRITFRRRGMTMQHSFVVCSKSSTGVTTYDCNRVGTNQIGYQTFTFAAMATAYDKCLGAQHHA